MVVVIFRARVNEEKFPEYYSLADDMAAIAKNMPGYISNKAYTSEDGKRVSIHEWESKESLKAWRTHPEHLKMQSYGREHFYKEYTLYVCDEPRESNTFQPQKARLPPGRLRCA